MKARIDDGTLHTRIREWSRVSVLMRAKNGFTLRLLVFSKGKTVGVAVPPDESFRQLKTVFLNLGDGRLQRTIARPATVSGSWLPIGYG